MSTNYYIGMFLFTMNSELVEQLTYNLWEKVVVIGLFRIKWSKQLNIPSIEFPDRWLQDYVCSF